MAEVNIPALFDHLDEQMVGLSTAIKNQGVSLDVRPFDGKAKDFKSWVNPRGDAGGLSREYVLRIPSVS